METNNPGSINFWQKAITDVTARAMLAPVAFSGAPALEQNEFDQPPLVVVAEERPELPKACLYPSYESSKELRFDCNRPSIVKDIVIVDFGDDNDQLVEDVAAYSNVMITEVTSGVVDVDFEIIEASEAAKNEYQQRTQETGCTDDTSREAKPSSIAKQLMPEEIAGRIVIALSPLPACNENVAGLGNYITGQADVFNVETETEEYRDSYVRHVGRVVVHEAGHSVLKFGHSGDLGEYFPLIQSQTVKLDQTLAQPLSFEEYAGFSVMGSGEFADYPILPDFFDCSPEFTEAHGTDNPLESPVESQPVTLSYGQIARGQYASIGLDQPIEMPVVNGLNKPESFIRFNQVNIVPRYEYGNVSFWVMLKSVTGCNLARVGTFHIPYEDYGNEVSLELNNQTYSIVDNGQTITFSLANS